MVMDTVLALISDRVVRRGCCVYCLLLLVAGDFDGVDFMPARHRHRMVSRSRHHRLLVGYLSTFKLLRLWIQVDTNLS